MLQDVGCSLLESYSRVMESLAFNIMARIDDLLYVDDASKKRAAAMSMCLYEQRRLGGAVPKQKRMSWSPFSIQHNSCGPSTTLPAMDDPPHPIARSLAGRRHHSTKNRNLNDLLQDKL